MSLTYAFWELLAYIATNQLPTKVIQLSGYPRQLSGCKRGTTASKGKYIIPSKNIWQFMANGSAKLLHTECHSIKNHSQFII